MRILGAFLLHSKNVQVTKYVFQIWDLYCIMCVCEKIRYALYAGGRN